MSGRTTEFDAALAALVPRLWRFALTLTHDRAAADDLVQATCERALTRAGQFEAGTRLDRWTFRILHSVWHNELRSRQVRKEEALATQPSGELDTSAWPGHGVSADEQTNKLQLLAVLHAIEALPVAQRETLVLVYVEGYAYREAAEILEIPIGTVMSRLASARLKLGRQFVTDDSSK